MERVTMEQIEGLPSFERQELLAWLTDIRALALTLRPEADPFISAIAA